MCGVGCFAFKSSMRVPESDETCFDDPLAYVTGAMSRNCTDYCHRNCVDHCKSIFSAPFYVYTAKKFPGMEGR